MTPCDSRVWPKCRAVVIFLLLLNWIIACYVLNISSVKFNIHVDEAAAIRHLQSRKAASRIRYAERLERLEQYCKNKPDNMR